MPPSILRALRSSPFLRPAVFGAFDGVTVTLGVLFSLSGHANLVFPATLGVALAEGVGMAAGEWLSDSDNGFGASLVIGGSTMAGSVAPALPWLWMVGTPALVASGVILAGLGFLIAYLRSDRGLKRALLETYAVLIVAIAVVAIVEHFTPGGAP